MRQYVSANNKHEIYSRGFIGRGVAYNSKDDIIITEIGGALYSSVGATDEELLNGLERFINSDYGPRINSQALARIIQIKTKRLINKQL